MTMTLTPLRRPVDAVVELPGSKSYTNRALLIAALAEGRSTIRRALFSEDTRAMHGALRALGIAVEADEAAATYTVEGAGGRIPAAAATLHCGNAGTAARFLTAAVALGHGRYVVDGDARMRQRPIGPLLDGLRQLGVAARSESGNDCPPVVIEASGLPGGTARVRGDISSQYLSALLLAGPYAERGVELEVEGELVSAPYLGMTAGIMHAFGVRAWGAGLGAWPSGPFDTQSGESGAASQAPSPVPQAPSPLRLGVAPGQRYVGREYVVEPDASNASYFFALAAVSGGRVRVPHLGRDSAQGDLGLLDVLARMGCTVRREADAVEVIGPERLRGVEADFTTMGDVATTLAAIAPFADSPVTIRGIAQTHFEESDRPVAAATELRRLGIRVEESWDALTVHPGEPQPAHIQTYRDHRLAMSFAITALRAPGITIDDPGCVAKTFPTFWEVLAGVVG